MKNLIKKTKEEENTQKIKTNLNSIRTSPIQSFLEKECKKARLMAEEIEIQ